MVQKVAGSSPGLAGGDWKYSSQPCSKWVHFSNQVRIRQRNEREELRFSYDVPKIQWASNFRWPYGL